MPTGTRPYPLRFQSERGMPDLRLIGGSKSPSMKMGMSGTICINHIRSFQMAFILGVLKSSELRISPEWIPFSSDSTSEAR